ncbi:MAG: CinA family protein [Alphaproteobacteria bacterium]|nr:CinA family protein [Alphaproteobacteria bacterium]
MTLAEQVFALLKRRGLRLATAESCTGGMVAAAITDLAGSSEIFDRGFVTYSNLAKAEMLGVVPALIATHGAVSHQVAIAMAEGALLFSKADISIAISGIAGPSGGSVEKPVGLVHFACAQHNLKTLHIEQRFGSLSRAEIRHHSVKAAFELVLSQLTRAP